MSSQRRPPRVLVAAAILALAAGLAGAAIWAPVDDRTRAASRSIAAPPPRAFVAADVTTTDPTDAPERRAPAAPGRVDGPSATAGPLEALLGHFLADRRVAGRAVSVSVSVEGQGEVLALDAGAALMPASVQKVATAAAVLERLPDDFAFTTRVVAGTPIGPDGTVVGDLVLVAGGDPTLARSGSHSLDALAASVAEAGLRRVEGRLLVDTSRWSAERASPGWLAWQQPRFVGWLAPLLADGNRWQQAADSEHPALANARGFAAALAAHGVTLADPSPSEVACPACAGGTTVAQLRSAGRDALVQDMLRTSDNLLAEAFLRELGFQADGLGSAASGGAVVGSVVADLTGAPSSGTDADGSGLSRLDARSAGEWRTLLVAGAERPWWPVLRDGLPVAAVSGTLSGRFGGSAAAGNVRAKTGTTVPARALAGVFTTASGLSATFAIVVNGTDGDPPLGAEGAIDELVASLVTTL